MACKKDPDWNTIVEPQSTSNVDNRSCYPYMNLYSSELHSLEMDDTPGNERIRLQHGNPDSSVSTFLEIHPDGTEVHKIYGDGYEIVTCNKKVLVKGSCTVVVEGNAAVEVKGNAWSKVKGNYTGIVEGATNIVCNKSINISADKEIVLAADKITFKAEQINTVGDLQLQGDLGLNESTYIDGNLNVTGNIFAVNGLLTTGVLVVGPEAVGIPNKGLVYPANFVDLNVGVGIIAQAVGAIEMAAGIDFTAAAGGKASLAATGVTTVSGIAGVAINSSATVGIAAATMNVGSSNFTLTTGAAAFPTAVAFALPLAKFIAAPKAILTVADLMCLNNPMFYSLHTHFVGPLPTTPPFPPGPIPVAAAT